MDVLEHLTQEHRKAESLLGQLADSEPGAERERLLAELQDALDVHMAVEERYLYPIITEAIGAEEEEGAENEHDLTRQGLSAMQDLVAEPGFGAAVESLQAGLKHHVDEEEDELFPQLRQKAAAQLAALPDPEQLERAVKAADPDTTKAELYEQAQDADIPGRSDMTKDELAEAVAEQE